MPVEELLDRVDGLTEVLGLDEITAKLAELRGRIEPFSLDVGLVLSDVCAALGLTVGQTQGVLGSNLYQLIFQAPAPILAGGIDWARIKASAFACPGCGGPLAPAGDGAGFKCGGCGTAWVPVPRDLLEEEVRA